MSARCTWSGSISGPQQRNVEEAKKLLEEAGQTDHEFELISVDDDWQRATADAIAAQMRDAGMNVKRTIIPGATFWNDWTKYPFSTTNWNARPLGVQVLALAYRSGEAWNEAGWTNPEFDAAAEQGDGHRRRRAAQGADGEDRDDAAQTRASSSSPTGARCSGTANDKVQGFPHAPGLRAPHGEGLDGDLSRGRNCARPGRGARPGGSRRLSPEQPRRGRGGRTAVGARTGRAGEVPP